MTPERGYWFTAVPRKPSKIGCGIRRKSKRRTADRYRSVAAASRRYNRKAYRKAFGHPSTGPGFKAWLRLREQVAA